jgi:hypothetical protein
MYAASNYPDSTIDTFELLGSKVVGVFYNHIYEKAKELHTSGRTPSTTEAYKLTMQSYLQHFKNEKLYKKSVMNIYEHFNHYSPVPMLRYSDFVDTVTREFVPTDYWTGLSSQQKDRILLIALEDSYTKMGAHMIKPEGLRRVIDEHSNKENLKYFQDLMMQVLIEERENLYQRFAKPVVGGTSAVTERLRGDLQKALAQQKVLKEALQKASGEIKNLTKQVEILSQAKTWLIERARDAEQARANATAELEIARRIPIATATVAPAPATEPLNEEVQEYIPVDLRMTDPYADLQAQIDGTSEPAGPPAAEIDEELAAFDDEEETPEKMKQRAKKRRAARVNNVAESKPDDLGL